MLDLAIIAVSKFISKRFLILNNEPKCNFEILLNYKCALFYVLNNLLLAGALLCFAYTQKQARAN